MGRGLAVGLQVQAFTLGLPHGSEVSPRHESDTAPSLAMSKDAVAETWSRNKHTETGLPARVPIGDEDRFHLSRSIPHYLCLRGISRHYSRSQDSNPIDSKEARKQSVEPRAVSNAKQKLVMKTHKSETQNGHTKGSGTTAENFRSKLVSPNKVASWLVLVLSFAFRVYDMYLDECRLAVEATAVWSRWISTLYSENGYVSR